MIVGHFGLAAGVKARETSVPLWSLMMATVWLDIAFVPLLLSGIEAIEPVPGTAGAFGQIIIHADWTHSLVGAVFLSAVLGVIAGLAWGRRAGWVLGGVSFSHWLLDLIVHRADMPVLPGNWGGIPRLGLGLWQYPFAEIIVEAAIIGGGAFLYYQAARSAVTSSGASSARPAMVAGLIVAGGVAILAYQASTLF
ncbi:permease [Zhengella mangrovi]|uniref:Permease n=1 Tax=Zhengella mangrovi TaxID=1982044 RepID=A0A2G1QH33_9HYPH|nr:permease [Zhengella mangrovi]PHP64822.1 permease [Zhengella mangrovi]